MNIGDASIYDANSFADKLMGSPEEEIVFEVVSDPSSRLIVQDGKVGTPRSLVSMDESAIPHTGTIEESVYSYDFTSGETHKKPYNNDDNCFNVSLRQVVQHNPMEYEAETYILKALETTEPAVCEQTILGSIPNDVCHQMTVQDDKTRTEFSSSVQLAKVLTTSENLRNLTSDYLLLHEDLDSDDRQRRPSTDNKNFENSSGATMTKRKIEKEKSGLDVHNHDVLPKTTAQRNWNKIKIAVSVASAVRASTGDLENGRLSVANEVPVDTSDDEAGDESHDAKGEEKVKSRIKKQKHRKIQLAVLQFKTGFKDFEDWVKFKQTDIVSYIKYLLLLLIPATGVASILFYLVGNPPCGTSLDCYVKMNSTATYSWEKTNSFQDFLDLDNRPSYSWWILFVCVRHTLLVTLAAITQAIMIDFLCIRSKLVLNLAGPAVTLYTVQSKGMPFISTFWGIYTLLFLYGDDRFANHWLFWQHVINMFNAANPSGGITSLDSYKNIIILAIFVGVATSVKRFWVSLFLGRQTYYRYASDLATLMRKILLIAKVARLGRDIEKYGLKESDFSNDHDYFVCTIKKEGFDEIGDNPTQSLKSEDQELFGNDNQIGRAMGYQQSSTRMKIEKLLGAWEEPREVSRKDEHINIGSIIQFRTSLACLNTTVPFSSAFGLASTRMQCIQSSENLYRRLLLAVQGKQVLSFDVIALIARNDDGDLDEKMAKELIKMFRPDREGNLTLIDFAKSVDSVYKEYRLLRASVSNNSRMDRAFENIINVFFWFAVGCIVLSVLGVDPLVLFASVSGFVLGFAFMIGAAASKYFEGILLILIRRPYDIGDRIHVSNPNNDTSSTGSATWFVQDVTLFTTTVCYAATNEVATYSNGSLASSRIINAARSPEASISFPLKFPISASYEKLRVFSNALQEFVRARPREYLSFAACRCSRIETDLGYVEYIVSVTHRESWQNMRSILNSKAELASFALELSKKMNLRYQSPPMPVDVRLHSGFSNAFGINADDNHHTMDQVDDFSLSPNKDELQEVFKIFDKK